MKLSNITQNTSISNDVEIGIDKHKVPINIYINLDVKGHSPKHSQTILNEMKNCVNKIAKIVKAKK